MDIVSQLTLADIPVKLRCAVCNKLAVDAYKLPCCDQSLCGSCQASSTDTCAVCTHSPLDPSTCTPNKSLRLTVKAFIKAEERKRNKGSVPTTPALPTTPSLGTGAVTPSEDPKISKTDQLNQDVTAEEIAVDRESHFVRTDQKGGDDTAEGTTTTRTDLLIETNEVNAEAEPLGEQVAADTAEDVGDQENSQVEHDRYATSAPQSGVESSNWPGGFMPMMPMAGMPGMFNPMMGMPFMGMNPMQMSNMMNGFGGVGMNDTSGMNMNMAFGNRNWDRQNAGRGDYNSGYGSGYNQQHYNTPYGNHHASRNNPYYSRGQGFQPRGQYRGRGGYSNGGRGGYNAGNQQQNFVHDPKNGDAVNGDKGGIDQTNDRSHESPNGENATHDDAMPDAHPVDDPAESGRSHHIETNGEHSEKTPQTNGIHRPDEGVDVPLSLVIPAPPSNAPTGPKAMRAGLPNSGRYSRMSTIPTGPKSASISGRTVAGQDVGADDFEDQGTSQTRSTNNVKKRKRRDRSQSADSQDDKAARERKRERDNRHDDDDTRMRSRSRSPGSDRRSRRSSHAHASRHQRRSRRDRSSSSHERATRKQENRHRRRSEDRGRDDRDRSREHKRDRSEGREDKKSRRRRSTSRSQGSQRHDRSRRARESRDDSRDRVLNGLENLGRAKLEPPADDIGFRIRGTKSAADQAEAVFAPPSGPRKDRSRDEADVDRRRSRRSSVQTAAETKSISLDPYAQEREARHRERVLKEEQRRMTAHGDREMSSAANGDDVRSNDAPTGPRADKSSRKARRINYKYEDEMDVMKGSRRGSRA